MLDYNLTVGQGIVEYEQVIAITSNCDLFRSTGCSGTETRGVPLAGVFRKHRGLDYISRLIHRTVGNIDLVLVSGRSRRQVLNRFDEFLIDT